MKNNALYGRWLLLLLLFVIMNGGCWGRKFFHAPGVTIETSARVDSLLGENYDLQRRISRIEKMLSAQQEYSRGVNAQLKIDLEELKDQLNVLTQILEENERTIAWKSKPDRESIGEADRKNVVSSPDSVFLTGDETSSVDSLQSEEKAVIPLPEEMHRQLYLDFSRMEYQIAVEESESFLAEYPDHPLGEEVRFIRGECFMELEKYFDALKEFSAILQEYPGRGKTPSVLLRIAISYEKIGDRDLAAGVVRRLIREYPGSEEAVVARERFSDMLDE